MTNTKETDLLGGDGDFICFLFRLLLDELDHLVDLPLDLRIGEGVCSCRPVPGRLRNKADQVPTSVSFILTQCKLSLSIDL